MRNDDIKRLYDDEYAASYEEKFLTSPLTASDSAHELQLLRSLLRPGVRWLDVACGTGYFLRHFVKIERKGLDRSPSMLSLARRGNPGIELLEHDFRVPMPAWTDRFDVVSCMWYAYCLVDTVGEVMKVIDNLAQWTSPSGTCFVPLADPALIAGVSLPYEQESGFAGIVKITAIIWSYGEHEAGKEHTHLVSPRLPFMIEAFERHFDDVELLRYPPAFPGWVGRPRSSRDQKEPFGRGRADALISGSELPGGDLVSPAVVTNAISAGEAIAKYIPVGEIDRRLPTAFDHETLGPPRRNRASGPRRSP